MRFNLNEDGTIREIGDQPGYEYEAPEGQNIGHHNFDRLMFEFDEKGKAKMEGGFYVVKIIDSDNISS